MEKQIFAWTGPTPTTADGYAQFVQLFQDGEVFRITIRGHDGVQHSAYGDHGLVHALVGDLAEHL